MTSSNFLIGPIKEGLNKNIKPAFNSEDSFETLTNAYQWRGRIVKRSGYTKLGRLANGTPVMGLRTMEGFAIQVQTLVAFDTTDAYEWNGTTFIALPTVTPTVWSGTNHDFFFTTNYADAFWATNSTAGLHGWNVTAFSGSAGSGNLATVNVTSAGNAVQVGDYVHFINLVPALVNNSGVLAIVTGAGNPYTIQATNLPATSVFSWTDGATSTGIGLDSFRSITGQDGIRYYGALTNGTGWANYNPPIDANNALLGALLIFPYRGYLVFLNTWEGNEQNVYNFGNRARWTQIGTPYYSPPVPTSPAPQTYDINAARDDLFGRGGANDAPTNEVIVGAAFIRDILVVYFERSTWRLRFVNNAQNPFVWERVNVELGSDCTFSTIPFDKGLMAIGNRGIVISDGNDTQRFDDKIPDDIFAIRQENFGLERVYGIRTFRTRLNYWTFPDVSNPDGVFPDKVLVYNYETKNWSYFDDCFTCFGYYYPSTNTGTWADLTDAWSSYGDTTWVDGQSQTGYENIVAGNQQGYVLLLDQTDGENGPSLSISAIANGAPNSAAVFTSAANNLPSGTWITLSGVTGTTSDDGVSLNGRNFKFANPALNPNTFTLTEFKPIDGGLAVGASYTYDIDYENIFPGSIQINVGALVFFDTDLDGILYGTGGTGTINYATGRVSLTFSPVILSSQVWIRLVSLDPLQGFDQIVSTTGVYGGGGEIAKISGFDVSTKLFNFFNQDQRARLSKIDFYCDKTTNGQFTCDIWADSSDVPVNTPLSDNLLSNVVLTSVTGNQVGSGDEVIYRLYADAQAQSIQMRFYLSDYQLAVNKISQSDIEIVALMVSMRKGGRLS